MSHEHLTIHTDGGARGNPGPAAIGVIIRAQGRIIARFGRRIGTATNNQAEYQAVHAALEQAKRLGGRQIDLYADSELIVKQLRGEYKMKNHGLGTWFVRIQSLVNQFGKVTFTAVPREQNWQADALVNEALDAPEESS